MHQARVCRSASRAVGQCLEQEGCVQGVVTPPDSSLQPEPHCSVAFVVAEGGWGFAAGPQSGFDGLSSTERQKFRFLKDIFTWALRAPGVIPLC